MIGWTLGLLATGPAYAQQVVATTNNELRLYESDGTLVASKTVPWPSGARPVAETVRDVVHVGDFVVTYNGTFEPWVSVLNTKTKVWNHFTEAGWGTVNNVSYGGLAVRPPYVFVTDMDTCCDADDALAGLVRFDVKTGINDRHDTARDYIDVSLGQDGRLYGLLADERTVVVYDPDTMVTLDTITLVAGVRGVAVSTNGVIWGASWDDTVYAFSPTTGEVLGQMNSAALDLVDVDVNADDIVVVSARFGDVILIDGPTFEEIDRFATGATAFVTFRDR